MSPNFEVYQQPPTQPTTPPQIRISNNDIALNKEAADLLGRPATVELLYDTTNRIVGVRPTTKFGATVFEVGTARGNGSAIIKAPGFAAHYGIPTDGRPRWDAYLDGGVLCADIGEDPSHRSRAVF